MTMSLKSIGSLPQADVASLGIESKPPLTTAPLTARVTRPSMHTTLSGSIGRSLGSSLAWKASGPAGGMGPVGCHDGAPYGEDVPFAGVVWSLRADHDLHFDRAREGGADGRQGIGPDEQSGVALG